MPVSAKTVPPLTQDQLDLVTLRLVASTVQVEEEFVQKVLDGAITATMIDNINDGYVMFTNLLNGTSHGTPQATAGMSNVMPFHTPSSSVEPENDDEPDTIATTAAPDEPMTVGEWLRATREAMPTDHGNKMSQTHFAAMFGVKKQTHMSLYERDKLDITYSECRSFARANKKAIPDVLIRPMVKETMTRLLKALGDDDQDIAAQCSLNVTDIKHWREGIAAPDVKDRRKLISVYGLEPTIFDKLEII